MALIEREILTSRKVLSRKSSTSNKFLFCKKMLSNYGLFSLKMSAQAKKNLYTFFVTIFQVSADEGMGKQSKLVEY